MNKLIIFLPLFFFKLSMANNFLNKNSNIDELAIDVGINIKKEPLIKNANLSYKVKGKKYIPITEVKSYEETGKASWYGPEFHNKKTTSGEIYDMYKMTAAHRTLPIPSYVKVTNLKNSKSITVRINDRGPFSKNRVIDLSYAAAKKLDFLNSGFSHVKIEQIIPNENKPTENFITLKSFKKINDAEEYMKKASSHIKEKFDSTLSITSEYGFYQVKLRTNNKDSNNINEIKSILRGI